MRCIFQSSFGSGRSSLCRGENSRARSWQIGTFLKWSPNWYVWIQVGRCGVFARRPHRAGFKFPLGSEGGPGRLDYHIKKVKLAQILRESCTNLPPPVEVKTPSCATCPTTLFSIGTCDKTRRTSSWIMYPSWSKSYLKKRVLLTRVHWVER